MNATHPIALGVLAVAVVLVSAPAMVSEAGSSGGTGPHPAGACSAPFHVQGAGWDVCWMQDELRVQGLELNRLYFHNESVAWKIGLPFSLTEYDQPTGTGPFKDVLGAAGEADVEGFGRGSMAIDDAACPRFFERGELVNDDHVCIEHRDGVSPAVALWAHYDIINYRFLQGYRLHEDGTIEPFLTFGGHLYEGADVGDRGKNHYHHAYWRVDLDIGEPGSDFFEAFKRPGPETATLVGMGRTGDQLVRTAMDALPERGCKPVGSSVPLNASTAFWCSIRAEAELTYDQGTHDKWRVVDRTDRNAVGHAKSYEFVVKSDAPADWFSSFDAMVVEYKGDSQELGYFVPSNPLFGDQALDHYHVPPEIITDPVVWLVHRTYHDTRDEDRGSMSYHEVDFPIRPRNFVDENPGEASFP